MTPVEIRAARETLGLTLDRMGTMLGYKGVHIRRQVLRLELGERPLLPAQERLLQAYLAGYRPPDWPNEPQSQVAPDGENKLPLTVHRNINHA